MINSVMTTRHTAWLGLDKLGELMTSFHMSSMSDTLPLGLYMLSKATRLSFSSIAVENFTI